MPGEDTRVAASPLKLQATATSPIPATSRAEKDVGKAWNTKGLPWRLGADATAAASAGVLVAPIITIIDR